MWKFKYNQLETKIKDLEFDLTQKGFVEIQRKLAEKEALYISLLKTCKETHVTKRRVENLETCYKADLKYEMNKFKDKLPKILQNQIEYFERGDHDKVWATGCCDRIRIEYQGVMQQQEKYIRSLA